MKAVVDDLPRSVLLQAFDPGLGIMALGDRFDRAAVQVVQQRDVPVPLRERLLIAPYARQRTLNFASLPALTACSMMCHVWSHLSRRICIAPVTVCVAVSTSLASRSNRTVKRLPASAATPFARRAPDTAPAAHGPPDSSGTGTNPDAASAALPRGRSSPVHAFTPPPSNPDRETSSPADARLARESPDPPAATRRPRPSTASPDPKTADKAPDPAFLPPPTLISRRPPEQKTHEDPGWPPFFRTERKPQGSLSCASPPLRTYGLTAVLFCSQLSHLVRGVCVRHA